MRFDLPIEFAPLTPEWADYCQFALQRLHEADSPDARFEWNESSEAFALLGVSGVETPAWFKLKKRPERNFMDAWSTYLGEPADRIITPTVTTAQRDGVVLAYFLRATVAGGPEGVGLFRVAAQILRSAHRLEPAEKEQLTAIFTRLAAT